MVDYDPASEAFYEPVDLDEPFVLGQKGLSPAEGGPQFHQQMVYAVAMNTIDQFERALGRVSLWASRLVRDDNGNVRGEEFVRRLRIYPHALREANAYYSPKKKALLFGYFPTRGGGPGQAPGGTVFTALSYDVVAHETTHALLDGLHPSFNEPTNPDVHALHEGFADVVALFQRFAHPEVLQHQIAKTRGNLEQQNMLGELATQVGAALGHRGALRDAIGRFSDETQQWELHKPDPQKLAAAAEPHERGGILLAAVFSAFLAIYKARSADLFRIATNGTGVLREGAIHPDLVRRLAREASNAAQSVLTMCIRGLDFCPPVDVDFGTYLRAVITADAEVWPQEKYAYRVAFAEAFRQWGIYPDGVRGMDEGELRYPLVDDQRASAQCALYDQEHTKDMFRGSLSLHWDLTTDREKVAGTMKENAAKIHGWLTGADAGPARRVRAGRRRQNTPVGVPGQGRGAEDRGPLGPPRPPPRVARYPGHRPGGRGPAAAAGVLRPRGPEADRRGRAGPRGGQAGLPLPPRVHAHHRPERGEGAVRHLDPRRRDGRRGTGPRPPVPDRPDGDRRQPVLRALVRDRTGRRALRRAAPPRRRRARFLIPHPPRRAPTMAKARPEAPKPKAPKAKPPKAPAGAHACRP